MLLRRETERESPIIRSSAFTSPLMESKTARLTILIDPEKKRAFEALCASQDLTPSQVVRQLIRDYLAEHGVSYSTAPTARKVK